MMQWLMDLVMGFVSGFLLKFPWFPYVATIIGTLRLVLKPAMSFVRVVLEAIKGKDAGDKMADDIEGSWAWKMFCYVLDWLASVKVGTQVKK